MLTLKVEGPAGLKVVEVWFPRDGDTVRLPGRIPRFVRLFHLERPVQGLLGWWQRRQTLVTDLSTIDDLDKRLSSSLRYQIRRSRDRDGLVMVDDWTPEQVAEFHARFNPENPSRPNLARLRALREMGRLLVRTAIVNGEPVCVHAIMHNGRIARGLYTYTARYAGDKDKAATVGRATKASDFDTLFHLREIGLKEYDWGGYSGRPNCGIDAYKRQFLGQLRRGWCFHGLTLPRASPLVF